VVRLSSERASLGTLPLRRITRESAVAASGTVQAPQWQ
jgi:hypothetical protein